MKAIVIQEEGKAAIVDVDKPSMRPDYIKVKTVALALNPSKSLSYAVLETLLIVPYS